MERFLNNPKHIKSHEILYLCHLLDKHNIIINIKADGIYSQIKYNNINYEGEQLNEFTYIFDILNYPKYLNSSYVNRIKFIKKQFEEFDEIVTIKTYDEFILEIKKDDISYNEKKKNNIIILKKSYLIKTSAEDFLRILEINLDDILFAFPTDGFIIILDEILNYPYKYKPKNKLTIDLYNSNCTFIDKDKNVIFINNDIKQSDKSMQSNDIWRCYYKEDQWVPSNQ
jgi:hypothetical protein